MIEAALAETRAELDRLDERRHEPLEQIARGEAILSGGPAGPTDGMPLTLHKALARVLEERGNEWMTARACRRGQPARPIPQARR